MTPSRIHWLALGFSLVGCFGDGSGESASIQPTLVAVQPEDFLGNVPCSPDPGALRSYIATFYDVEGVGGGSAVGSGIPLFSSPPVDCRRTVGTQNVTDDHHYAVEIHAFDRPACDGGAEDGCVQALIPGTPIAADASGNVVAPRWTTACGRGDRQTVLPVDFTTVYIHDCDPLVLDQATTTSAIRLAVDGTLGALACGSELDSVDHFTVIPEEPALATQNAVCGDVLEFAASSPGREYAFRVEAYEPEATTPRWASSCRATAVAGAQVSAICTALTSQGAILLDVAALLGSSCGDDGTVACECGADFAGVAVTLPESLEPNPEPLTGQACRQTLSIAAEAGSYTFEVELRPVAGDPTHFTCQANVAPLADERAVCTPVN